MSGSRSRRVQVNQAIQQYFRDPETPDTKEDWTLKPELPSAGEILGDDPPSDEVLLAPNHISTPWPSVQTYLRTHYKLVREDSVAPLRDAVAHVRNVPQRKDTKDLSVYEKVYIVGATLATRGLAFTLRFSTRRAGKKIVWKYSNRLLEGSVVALSPAEDTFSTKCVVAVVAARPLDKVNRDPPEIDIFFANPEDICFDPQKEWIMVEARSGFPLRNHICRLDQAIDIPESVAADTIRDLRALSPSVSRPFGNAFVDILGAWPEAPMEGLDRFQWAALRQMLTKRLAIVQGPPGTGKTFVSVAALKVLLSNMRPGDPPIIVAAQTNHALDQFLTHVAQFEPNYIRLGRRSTDVEIRQRSLFSVRNEQGRWVEGGVPLATKQQHQDLVNRIVDILDGFSGMEDKGPIESSSFLRSGLLTQEQCDSLQAETKGWLGLKSGKYESPMSLWLGGRLRQFEMDFSSPNFVEDEIDLEYEQLRQLEAQQGLDEDTWEGLSGKWLALVESLHAQAISPELEATAQVYLQNADLCVIPPESRSLVYSFLRHRLVGILTTELRQTAQLYEDCCKMFKIGNWSRDSTILQGAKVVGMTTTGLSKYRGLVASLNPQVVVIEEAAQVIEAPVTVACFESLQQLILIGDHQQLKGQCAVHELAGPPFHLDISMFERLVTNNMTFTKLQEQRRMAPEIRSLLTPIYGNLLDHRSVHKRPPVPGMGDVRLFFMTHNFLEDNDNLASKFNEFEASMVTELYAYLVMNGISDRKITILTYYQGQKKKILKMAKTHQHLARSFVNVATVDSYQGEENDIILLSLVRSHAKETEGIGFLTVDSRVCVALSRAKCGLYIFGNANSVSLASPLWEKVVNMMSAPSNTPRLGKVLPITCQTHQQRTMIEDVADWKDIKGGCTLPCRQELPCGHNCPIQCHGFHHDWVVCKRVCAYKYPCCGANCMQKCHPAHDHRCHCPASAADLAAAESTTPKPILPESPRLLELDTDLPIRTPRRLEGQPRQLQRQPRELEAQHRWNAFARGGVRQIDRVPNLLPNASTADEEGVQQAMQQVDQRLIPRRLLKVEEEKVEEKKGSVIGDLIDLD